MAKKPDQYKINTFEQLLNVVNTDNCERLAIDLGIWLIWYANVMAKMRKDHPTETDGKLNWEITQSGFTWIDDGKNDLKHVSITDPRTGKTEVRKSRKPRK